MTFNSTDELLEFLLDLPPGGDTFIYGEVSQELVDQLPDDFTVVYSSELQLTYFYRETHDPRP